MKIGLVGFGKAGKAVASVILQNKHFSLEWVLRKNTLLEKRSVGEFLGIESKSPTYIYSTSHTPIATLLDEHPVDYIIDFSSETGIETYGEEAAKRGIKIISAASHYPDATVEYLKELSKQTVVFWSANITLGVNFLMFAAKFLKMIAPWADIKVSEEHFKEKSGISGTAKILATALDINEQDINSTRAGGIVGRHEIVFGFPYQTVRLIHDSISREAFGNGALFAATNLKDKSKGFYRFEDVLQPYLAI